MSGDPGHLRALSARLRHEAAQVRMLSIRAERTTDVPWQSWAADSFRRLAEENAAGLRMLAHRLDEAADVLERHARAVAIAVEVAAGMDGLGSPVVTGLVRPVMGLVG